MMMTPFKGSGGAGPRTSNHSSGSTGAVASSSSSSDTPMEEETESCSVLSSPPRSGPRSTARLNSLFFVEEHKDGHEERTLNNTSQNQHGGLPFPPVLSVSRRLSPNPALTPRNNRRLFADEDQDTSPTNNNNLESGATRAKSENNNRSPFVVRNPRSTKSTALRNFLDSGSTFGVSLSMDDGDTVSATDDTSNTTSRKRSSAERRAGGGHVKHGSVGDTGGEGGSSSAYLSPRISPNSFMTMDGRFVHSKNPFSSPMMTDDPANLSSMRGDDPLLTANAPTLPDDSVFYPQQQQTSHTNAFLSLKASASSAVGGPPTNTSTYHSPLPKDPSTEILANTGDRGLFTVPFPSFLTNGNENGNDDNMGLAGSMNMGFPALSPRRDRPNRSKFMGLTTMGHDSGFPGEHRSSFTGSPIFEHAEAAAAAAAASVGYHPTGAASSSNSLNTSMDAMETDTASCGSLQKVRRLNLNDDVVSASGHALRNRVSTRRLGLRIDTSDNTNSTWMQGYHREGSFSGSSISSQDGPYYYNNGSSHPPKENVAPSNSKSEWNQDHDDISPTDVLSFPSPPSPSDIKTTGRGGIPNETPIPDSARPNPYQWRSNTTQSRVLVPPTPVAERRRLAALAARTPHPGSLIHNHRAANNYHPHHHTLLAGTSSAHGGGRSDASSSANAAATMEKSRFYGDFDIISELGRGCFGTVYKVLSRLDGCMYAIKAAKRQAKGQSDRDRMLKEVYALAALSDQAHTATFHIVRYHQAWMEEDRLYIQTELCQGSVADEVAKNENGLPLVRRYKLLREICLALEFLHQNNMVHLDIKPDNIFVKNDQFKLGDFGLVTKISISSDSNDDVEEGDSRYMSMELLAGDHTDLTKSDIFSLGATLYEISLRRPLPLNGQEWQDFRAGRLTPLPQARNPQEEDPELMTMLEQMMHPTAKQRPAASELLKRRQLLSDEQKALIKVVEANMALQQIQLTKQHEQHPHPPHLPMRRGLQRANTWNGHSLIH